MILWIRNLGKVQLSHSSAPCGINNSHSLEFFWQQACLKGPKQLHSHDQCLGEDTGQLESIGPFFPPCCLRASPHDHFSRMVELMWQFRAPRYQDRICQSFLWLVLELAQHLFPKASPDSKRREIYSTSQGDECQGICGHL